MNCYLCLIETGCNLRPAFALCQQCGAGMCAEHLVELTLTPVVGMGSVGNPRQSLICRRCYQSAVLPPRVPQPQRRPARQDKQETSAGWKWWDWFRGHQQPELPDSEEAVAIAELFLRRQRSQ
jgi:hypothetical protein